MILTITGASAAGKTTLAAGICRSRNDASLLGSVTTRAARATDLPNEYACVSHTEFERYVLDDAFIWHIGVHGHRYGTLRSRIDETLDASEISIAIITLDALNILREHVRASRQLVRIRSIHLLAAPDSEMRRRLEKRDCAPAEVARRIEDCVRWDQEARASGLPILFLDSAQPKEHVLDTALGYLSAATGRCSIPPAGS
ncbi:hypothetical protein FJY94_03925 [Candidatus Kaiserbacteria bacterium]|nr:hypothetical protein [Candidatus Kaiserbacteria bacterium]